MKIDSQQHLNSNIPVKDRRNKFNYKKFHLVSMDYTKKSLRERSFLWNSCINLGVPLLLIGVPIPNRHRLVRGVPVMVHRPSRRSGGHNRKSVHHAGTSHLCCKCQRQQRRSLWRGRATWTRTDRL